MSMLGDATEQLMIKRLNLTPIQRRKPQWQNFLNGVKSSIRLNSEEGKHNINKFKKLKIDG